MPAAGRTAMGSCRLRPIFCRPWNALFQRARAGLTVLSALIRSPSGRRYTGVDQLTDGSAAVTPSFGTSPPMAREDGPTVGYCDKAVRIREKNMASKAEKIVAGLGGIDNIDEIEGCITRLRTEVNDPDLVNEAALKAAGAHGVVKMGTAIQVVIGTDADPIAAEIEDMM
ncbi:PTS glucose/sucrose transporter subunit IIB [Streptomyces sp. CRB46]|uniref:PTS glucose/sucrose transporter subunit IIB n=1 Tax=Streptomyces sp. CRB46 TaxID=2682613 RepID=UPI0027B895D2|nr:PTS glucose/sucrose transporter subunit IIB [Streptomyces sp. CRB46]